MDCTPTVAERKCRNCGHTKFDEDGDCAKCHEPAAPPVASKGARGKAHIDVAALKHAASGRWPEILSRVAGIPVDLLDGKNHPCPKCGGRDRFRLIDIEAGAVLCNQCFAKGNGDGIAAIRWALGCDFKTAVDNLAAFLGFEPVTRNGKSLFNIVATYDYRNERGELLYQVVRFDPKGFRQRRPKGNGGWEYSVKGTRLVPYRLPDLMAAPSSRTVFLVEGEKDADRAAGMGMVATTCAMGAGKWRPEYNEHFRGRSVCIVPDNDKPGREHAQHVAMSLHGIATNVKVVELPGVPEKGDLSGWLDQGHTKAELEELAKAAPAWQPASDSKLGRKFDRTIIVGLDETRVADEAIDALAARADTYQRGGMLMQVVRDADPPKGIRLSKGTPRIVQLRQPALRERLADSAAWAHEGDDGLEYTHPPAWVVQAVDARGEWRGIRRLEGVVEIPVLRADGSVLQTPGYDDETGLLFEPASKFAGIPASPTLADAELARDALLEVVADFPFAADEHRSAWIALTLTPIARSAFDGPAPLVAIDSNVRGSGKSKLVDSAALIVTGREAARMTAPRDDEETRKRITALAVSAEPLILIDNVFGTLGSPSLDAALTATVWTDRILGRTEMIRAPLRATWCATGNNLAIVADTMRRVLPIRLESREENPEDRSDFAHPDLLGWIRHDRPRLAAAAVTILAAYCAAGRPAMGLTTWGSFEGWSSLIRQAVVWCGLPDPAANRRELLTQADVEAALLRRLLAGWEELDPTGAGVTVASAIERVANYPAEYQMLLSALVELTKDGKLPSARTVGMKLHHLRHRVMGGRFFDSRDHKHTAVWTVRRVDVVGLSGSSGTKASPFAHAHTHTRTREASNAGPDSPTTPTTPTPDLNEADEKSYAEFMRC